MLLPPSFPLCVPFPFPQAVPLPCLALHYHTVRADSSQVLALPVFVWGFFFVCASL